MKKTYIAPEFQVVVNDEAICQLVVASGNTANATGEQLTKEDNAWDIWGDEEE